ncbi:hypothetical protein ABIE44_000785 [Marmoricola sp. OAE513]|uniref:hypothetical protein n=1 Tax=Marmoricola sp. OAE513 TaxID=2817894 RepID=UPI001AE41C0C
MKLASLGVITVALGIGLGLPGLIGIGIWWILLGPVMRQHGKSLTERQKESPDGKPPADLGTFLYGTLLWALLAVPSLIVGILLLGIDADHEAWRWLPIAVGGLAAAIGGVALLLYSMGNAAQAYADKIGVPESAATIWIEKVTETGTYINERPRMEFELRVEPDAGTGLASYQVTKKATVPFTAMSGLRVGDGFRALVVGAENPTAMEIHWDQPVAGSGAPAGDVTARLEALDRLRTDGRVTETEYAEQRARILGTL